MFRIELVDGVIWGVRLEGFYYAFVAGLLFMIGLSHSSIRLSLQDWKRILPFVGLNQAIEGI